MAINEPYMLLVKKTTKVSIVKKVYLIVFDKLINKKIDNRKILYVSWLLLHINVECFEFRVL